MGKRSFLKAELFKPRALKEGEARPEMGGYYSEETTQSGRIQKHPVGVFVIPITCSSLKA